MLDFPPPKLQTFFFFAMQVYNYLNTALHPIYTLAVHHLLPGEPQPGTRTTSSGQPPTPSYTSVP